MIERGIANALGWAERRLWPRAPVILIYHRVADPMRDVWGITVGPERFAEQIEALKRVRRVVPLGELIAAAASGEAQDPLAAVTFDDGYQDVFTAARPILHRLDCPATVFVVSGMVGAAREFWWDELAYVFLEPHELPQELELRLGGRVRRWRLPAGERGARGMACHEIRRVYRDMAPAAIEQSLAELRSWARVERPARPQNRAMTPAEVAAFDDGLLSVGAHTVRHPSMPFLPLGQQQAEAAESRAACEALVGRPVAHFAYPFGAYDWRSARAARAAGFASACTTVPSVVRRGANPFRLPRIAPAQMDGEALARALG